MIPEGRVARTNDAERSREQSANDARANIAGSVGAQLSAADSMIPATPMRPAPPEDPPESRRATLVLNLALLGFAAAVILSNLLFFRLGPDSTRRTIAERPAASAPVVVALPEPKPPAPATGDPSADDAAVLERIEPTAAPPPAEALDTVAEPAPPTPPQVVASLPPADEPVPTPPPVPAVETAAAPPALSPLSPEEIEALTRRGDSLLLTGDIIAARVAFERAARAGSAAAATGVGKTFDPLFLTAAGVRGIQGNPFEAAAWYRRGSAAGDREAESRLRALHLQFPQ